MRLPRRVLSPEFIAAWRAFEAANRKAAEQYRDLPIAHYRAVLEEAEREEENDR